MPTTNHRDVIYKLVITEPGGQTFQVAADAKLVAVGCDPYQQGPAVWFRRHAPNGLEGIDDQTTIWHLGFRGTGDPFPTEARYLGTALMAAGTLAFHVLDLEGNVKQ